MMTDPVSAAVSVFPGGTPDNTLGWAVTVLFAILCGVLFYFGRSARSEKETEEVEEGMHFDLLPKAPLTFSTLSESKEVSCGEARPASSEPAEEKP